MSKVLITGANGFVGSSISNRLDEEKRDFLGCVRSKNAIPENDTRYVVIDQLDQLNFEDDIFDGIDTIVHTAAKVHVMGAEGNHLGDLRIVNVDSTVNLAKQAVKHGVRRFIFLSSIKVNGEETKLGSPFRNDDLPNPFDSYAISKFEAEEKLKHVCGAAEMDFVVIRPPLVYGHDVKANFLRMMRWVNLGVPLPLGAIHNKRSFVAIDNLVDLIVTCIDHPAAANQTFLVGDGEDLSTSELLRRIGKVLGKPSRLIPIPSSILFFLAALLGKKEVAQRLCGSLQVDISKAHELLGWEPPVSVDEGLRKTVEGFIQAISE